jgi:Ca-activated chloride channel family protein
MRSSFLLLVILFFSFVAKSQVIFSATKHNFVDLLSYSARYIDITVTNQGVKDVLIFSIRKPKEVASIISAKRIAVDSSSVLRFQVNPVKKGKFSYEIEVFTNDKNEATIIKLKGDLLEFEPDNNRMFTACPSFGDRPIGRNPNDFDLTVVTVDKQTRKELSQSLVTLIQRGQQVWIKETNKRGEVKENATLGLSYFLATHQGYLSAEMGTYINFKRNLVVIELLKDTLSEAPVIPVVVPVFKNDVIASSDTVDSKNDVVIAETNNPLFSELDFENFDDEHFKPINVVFILDVSSSMRQADRIELMKYSLMQLTEMLRPQDKFSIVTYASGVRVLLPPTSGDSKEVIKEEIKTLNAAGFTSGGEGIKLGFKTAFTSKITNGANHVIIITDGAFNRDSQDYKKYIKKYKRKGITFSVVGIKNKPKEEQAMRADAKLGGGRYVPIMKLSDAEHNLKQEIRIVSFKN